MTSNRSLFLTAAFAVALGALLGACRQYPDCKRDDQCVEYGRNTPYCVDRTCRECRDDGQCGFCEQCDSNSCVRTPGCCGDDTDCPSPMVCRDQRCAPQCYTDADCGDLERCLSGECIEVECRTDDQCPDGYRCENYVCVAPVDNTPCANRTFRPVLFDFDESTVRADQISALEWGLACFERFEGNTDVEGHCDERGTVEYNLALGDRRARIVRAWYEEQSIDRARMNKISYGESRPVARGTGESNYRQNRRVEIVWR